MASPNWLCIEDAFHRKGEQTERGLFFATQNIYCYTQAIKVFNYLKNKYNEVLIIFSLLFIHAFSVFFSEYRLE